MRKGVHLQVFSGCPAWGTEVGICTPLSGSTDTNLGWEVGGGIYGIGLGHRDIAKKFSVLLGYVSQSFGQKEQDCLGVFVVYSSWQF